MATNDTAVADGPPPPRIEIRLRLPLLWLVPLFVVAIVLPDRAWNTLLVGLGGMVLVSYGWVRLLAKGLHARRRVRFSWVSVGDRLSEQFVVENHTPLPALWVEILDHSNVPGYRVAVVRSLASSGRDRWRQSAVCQQRGQFQLGPWAIRTGDPFGIFTMTRHYPQVEEIIIHPPVHGQLPIPLPAGQSSGRANRRQRAWQATVNAATIRDYQPGDPQNWIHWRTSARKDELLVRQFDEDAGGDLWLVLDLQQDAQLGSGIDGTEEHSVLLAASLAARALQQNRKVGLAVYGRSPQIVPPARGEGQRWRILRSLALVSADSATPLSYALQDVARTSQRGTTAVIITPRPDPDWLPGLLTLSQRGIESNVILLDRASFGGERSSAGLREAVRHLGYDCHLLRQGEVGTPLEAQEQRGFWEFKVTGTGKAVAVKTPFDEKVKG